MNKNKHKTGLTWETFKYIFISLIIALFVYALAHYYSLSYLQGYVSDPDVSKKLSDGYCDKFQEYVSSENISSHDGRKIAEWNEEHSYLSLLISDEKKMIYNSFISYTMYFDEEENKENNPDDSFDWGTKNLPVHVYQIRFSDETAKLRLSGYFERHFDAVRNAFCFNSMFMSFAVAFIVLFRKKIGYIKEIEEGINNIKNGQYTYKIRVCGRDELAELSENINVLGQTIDNYMMRELEFQNKKNEMIRSIAHDIRTPLTGVMGYLEVLKGRLSSDDETSHTYLQRAHYNASHINDLVEDLFDVQSDDFQSVVQFEKLNCLELFSQVIIEIIDELQDAGFNVKVDNKIGTDLFIFTNTSHLARVFHNIISNIIRYGDAKALVETTAEACENYLHLTITNGKNPDREKLGRGLGLNSCRSIMQLHKGTLETEETESTFRIRLHFPLVL